MTIAGGDSASMTPPSESGGGRLGGRRQTVEVCRSDGGAWEVLLPDGAQLTTCETLSAARRVARSWAQQNPPSELIIRDAYHRVMLRRSF